MVVLQLFYEWPVYSRFWFLMSILLLLGLVFAAYLYSLRRTRKDRLWLKFVGRCLQQGMTYAELESLKPLYTDLYATGLGGVFLEPVAFRPHLLRFLAEHQHDGKEVRRDVHIFRKLAFPRHTEELMQVKELDLMEPVSIEALQGESVGFCQVVKVHTSSLELHLLGRAHGSFAVGEGVQLYFYRPASGGFLLRARIESIVDRTITAATNYQFVHADERHFMADIAMKASLCINMVPLIRLKTLPSLQAPSESPEAVQWKHLDPQIGQFTAETVRVSDRGIVLFIDGTTTHIDKNFLNQAYLITLDFIDGEPLEAVGHLLGMGRRGYYLFRFGELSAEARSRINQAVKDNHPQKERLV